MRAVILVGGEGTRLRPLTCNMPKPMVPIVNQPFLQHMLRYLKSHDVHEVVLAICYLPEVIESFFGDGSNYDITVSYSVEEEPLGTAGAVKNLEGRLTDTFLVFNGDIYTDLDLGAMLAFHKSKGSKATLFLTPVEDPSAFGVVETDADGRVLRFLEKPAPGVSNSKWINGGVYLLEPEVLEQAPYGEHYMFERGLFPKLLDMGFPVYGYQSNPYWLDLGTPHSYMQVHKYLLESQVNDNLWTNNVTDTNTFIHPSSQIQGNVVFGYGCSVGAGAILRGPLVLGDGCSIGQDAMVAGSVLWKDVSVGMAVELNGCIVGDGVYIGDYSSIGDKCILGDNSIVGEGNHLGDGVILWPEKSLQSHSLSSR